MTEITYSMENGRYTLEAKGHAGYDKHGHDIICAAVSALLQMGWAGLKNECLVGGTMEQRSGYFFFDCHVNEGKRKEADTLMKSVIYGLKLIEDGAPKYLKVQQKGGGGNQN